MTNLIVYRWRDGTRISVLMSELLDEKSEIKNAIAFLNILHGQAEIFRADEQVPVPKARTEAA